MRVYQYRAVAANLSRAGWVCTGGIYPNSTAEGNQEVTWQGNFERSNGKDKAPDKIRLTPANYESDEIKTAIGIPVNPRGTR